MPSKTRTSLYLAIIAVFAVHHSVTAQAPDEDSGSLAVGQLHRRAVENFRLHAAEASAGLPVTGLGPFAVPMGFLSMQTADSTADTEDAYDQMNYELAGPYSLRSADPEHSGEVVIKNIIGWNTYHGGQHDDGEYEFEMEWGIVENHELIFAVPVEIGNGRVDGNGDIEVGYHWRLWKETDWFPAFGMRNFIRIPTGVGSSGVDYEWIGLITKSIVPGELRFNINPFVKSVNGNNTEDARHFLWGATTGLDWRVRGDLILVGAYRYETGEIEHTRDNHVLELGADWTLVEHHRIGIGTDISLDGDSDGPGFAVRVSYMLSF